MIELDNNFFEDIKNKNILIRYTNLVDYKNKKLLWEYPDWYPTFDNNINNDVKDKIKLFKKNHKKYFIKIIVNEKEEHWINFPINYIKLKIIEKFNI